MSLLDLKSLIGKPEELRELIETLFSKGKSVRCRMVHLVGKYVKLKPAERRFLCRLVEYIHSSSLLHDDLIDHSRIRRNHITAWLEFSPEQAVLAGDYLLAQVGVYLSRQGNLDLLKITSETIMSLVEGEFLQRELIRDKKENPSNVKKVGRLKTAGLFKWSLRAPFIYKNRNDPEFHKLLDRIGSHIGILFQRSDDLLDFSLRGGKDKDIFTDLRQNYLNSFACFLADRKGASFRGKLRKIRNFKGFSSLVPDYKNEVSAFDKMNQLLIKKAKRDIEKLEKFLSSKEKGLVKELKAVPLACYRR